MTEETTMIEETMRKAGAMRIDEATEEQVTRFIIVKPAYGDGVL